MSEVTTNIGAPASNASTIDLCFGDKRVAILTPTGVRFLNGHAHPDSGTRWQVPYDLKLAIEQLQTIATLNASMSHAPREATTKGKRVWSDKRIADAAEKKRKAAEAGEIVP